MASLLSVRNMSLALPAENGPVYPVDGVDFEIEPGECVGLVGESGCGKSLTAQTIIGLSRYLPGSKASGKALWQTGDTQTNLLDLSEPQLSNIRGSEIAMVFQDPLSALNPLLRINYQISEVLKRHEGLAGSTARKRVVELLTSVGIPQPQQRASQYPHQLSGGLRQRVLLALALAGNPRLLIADEPTTALDVTIQAQIIIELKRLQAQSGMALLFITHDLGVVAQLCSRVLVMYAGKIIENAPVGEFFANPLHPYSQGLLSSLPQLSGKDKALRCIPGSPPKPAEFPTGCRFHPRCPIAIDECKTAIPDLLGDSAHRVACIKVGMDVEV